MTTMPGEPDNLKRRKRKRSSEMKSSRKASTTRRKTHSAAESSLAVGGSVERLSHISCECHQSTDRRRCSASPELSGQDGKENELRTGLDLDLHSCRVNHIQDKEEDEEMDYEDIGKNFFPDDDSNQILPVEQFFGNLDAVQDFPQQSPATSANVQRENRRRHYYAREDSDEEEVGVSGVQRDDREGI